MRKKVKRRKAPAHKSERRILGETYVYLMHNFPHVWVSKFGITDHTDARVRDVSDTTPGDVFYVFPPSQVPFGKAVEGFVHSLYSWANAPFNTGSGRSEWFLNINPLCFALFAYGCRVFGFDAPWYFYGVVFISPVVWLDGVLWLLFFTAFWWAVAVGGVVGMWYFWLNN